MSVPSWQSQQRQPSLPPGFNPQQAQGFPLNGASPAAAPQAGTFPNGVAQPPASLRHFPNQSIAGVPPPSQQEYLSNTSSDGFAPGPNGTQTPNGQVHRRTQSLRPFSAFQPLDSNRPGSVHGDPNQVRPASPTGSTVARSIRSTPAPLTFKSPDLRKALALQDAQGRKIYMEGYLSKREELATDGKPIHSADPKKQWQLCFVQLSGTVLSIWNVKAMEEAAQRGQEVPPSYTNITDSFVDYIGHLTEDKQAVPYSKGHYENVFALNTAGNNRIYFCVEGPVGRRLVQAWVNAIRLASWEKARLEEIYTGALLRARMGAVGALQRKGSISSNSVHGSIAMGAENEVDEASIASMAIKSPLTKGKLEGWVKARFMGSTEWKKCWLVLCDKPEEAESKGKFWKLGGSGSRSSVMSLTASPAIPGAPPGSAPTLDQIEPPPGSNGAKGIGLFYENKKSKQPFAAVMFVGHAFAVYPSRPELVEGSSLFKVEGAFPMSNVLSGTNRIRQTGWVMLMPDLEGGASKGANAEMMKWVIGFMDAFRLYGRPETIDWEPRNPISAFFAYPIGAFKDRLFLDRELAEFLDVREERHLAHRANLHGIMSMRMRGERTPILPPLPQPNKDSTAALNIGSRALAAGAAAATAGPGTKGTDSTKGLGANGRPELPAIGTDLPSLDFDPAATLGGTSNSFLGSNTTSSPVSRTTGLESIGERSREASSITTMTTGTTGGTIPVLHSQGPSAVSQRFVTRDPSSLSTHSTTNQPPAALQPVQPSTTGGPTFVAPTPAVAAAGAAAAVTAAAAAAAVPPQEVNVPGTETAQHATYGSSATGQSQRDVSVLSQASSIPRERGSEAAPSNAVGPSKRNSDAVALSSYDEGALFYMRAMSDQLPAPSSTANAPTAGPASATTSTTSVSQASPATGPTQSQFVNGQAMATPTVVAAAVPSALGAPSTSTKQENPAAVAPKEISPAAAAQNVEATPAPSALPPTSTAPIAAAAAAPGSLDTITQARDRQPSLRGDGSIGEDALAAYNYLEKPPSPVINNNAPALHPPSSEPDTAPTPLAKPGQAAFPSSFNNKRAAERKNAAQLQAQAHQDAMSKPGRPDGNKKRRQGSHAWGADSSEEEEEEEDEEEEETEEDAKAGLAGPLVPPQPLGARGSVQNPSDAGSFRGAPASNTPSQAGGSGRNTPSHAGAQVPRPGEFGAARSQSPAQNPAGFTTGAVAAAAAAANARQPGGPGARHSVFNTHLGSQHIDGLPEQSSSQGLPSPISQPQGRQTFVQLNPSEQPGSMTAVFQPQGLLQAGAQEKAERSAKAQEAEARQQGSHLVSVPNKPPPPQAGLLGAITAHEKERKGAGGFGATLTERERERVNAERKQREEEAFRQQQQIAMQQMGMGAPGAMPFMNPYMMWGMMPPPWMQPGYPGFPGYAGSQAPGSVAGPVDPMAAQAQAQQAAQAQMQAMQAAQMAYAQAMSQAGVEGGSVIGGPTGSMPPMSAPFGYPMSMIGSPMAFNPMMAPPSEMGSPSGLRPQRDREPSQERFKGSPSRQ